MSPKEVALLFILVNYICILMSESKFMKFSFIVGLIFWEIKFCILVVPEGILIGNRVVEALKGGL